MFETFCHCCDMLHSNVAIVWPELANAEPTMLGYVGLRCYDRLAQALGRFEPHVQCL